MRLAAVNGLRIAHRVWATGASGYRGQVTHRLLVIADQPGRLVPVETRGQASFTAHPLVPPPPLLNCMCC